ncbi:MAG: phosphoethanolamine transferase, partial [Oxalobacteraceae bacterium]
VLWACSMASLGYFFIYQQEFSQSVIFIMFESNISEAGEYMTQYFAWWMVPAFLAHTLFAYFLWTRLRPVYLPRGRAFVAATAIVVAVVGYPLVKQTMRTGSFAGGFEKFETRIEPAVPWQMAVAYHRYLDTLAEMQGMLHSANQIPPLHNLTDAGANQPSTLVLVIGESTNRQRMSLYGYPRKTTPELAASDVINFPHVTACGTNTEVSLPCMFSPYGRRHYDEKQIRRHESVLHVMEHAGIKTLWRDNQSGCKGVCDGLEVQRPEEQPEPRLCKGNHCLDEILLSGLESALQRNPRDLVIVLHQLGNHGPAYSQRYPDAFRRFMPTCDEPDLGKCSREQIVNSYDNALLYTDHFLAQALQRLQVQGTHEAALIYVSDHGESLGENGVYLHGLPYAIAPREQTEVPMLLWLSPGFAGASGIDAACLRARAAQPASHDYLFHTMLGLMQVQTAAYDGAFDLLDGCRGRARAGA